MIELTREQAEMLFSDADVKQSRIEPMHSGFKIVLELADNRHFFVHYNTKNHQKIYFLEGTDTILPTGGVHTGIKTS